ncbi:MAG: cell surface protein [Bacteroidaceae bacterium]|nr:cell surface protein [Bacteroidaceae bacterium]
MKQAFYFLLFTFALCASAQSPYISKVYEFMPAPGQFVNELPEWEEKDNADSIRKKVEDCIANHNQIAISLGNWGGYVIFGFDHEIPNKPGEYDIKILGNSFYYESAGEISLVSGSAEPGIVMVSRDANGNGLPDDDWYELAGSAHNDARTRHGYTCTYYRTPDDHVATPDGKNKYIKDSTYIRWTDSDGETGYVRKLSFNRQNYYPNWIDADSMVFHGTRLPDNSIDRNGSGTDMVLYCYDWGYVDNHPNQTKVDKTNDSTPEYLRHVSEFKIDWAVDEEGNAVELPGIHFVKVYTGVNLFNGWMGEASTELLDAWDLHMLDADGKEVKEPEEPEEPEEPSPYDLDGDGRLTIDDITALISIYLQ